MFSVQDFYKACIKWLYKTENMDEPSFIIASSPELVVLTNGFNIDENLAKFLYGGTIIQNDTDYFISNVKYGDVV